MITALKSETTKKIAANTIYQLVGKLVSMTITILATVIITRMYGREGYGDFNLMQAYPALFFIIVDFGINAIATRELTTHWEKAQQYLGNIIVIRMVLALFLMLGTSLVISLLPYDSELQFGLYLSLFLILTQALYATTNVIFQVKLRYDYSTFSYITGYILTFALVLLLSSMRINVAWVNFSYVIGGLATFLLNLRFIQKMGLNIALSVDKQIVKYLMIQSLPLGLMFIFSQINFKADAILLSALPLPEHFGLNSKETVAIYGLPYKIFEVALVVPTFFMNAVYPIFVKHMGESKERLKQTFLRVLVVLFGCGLITGVVGVLLSPFMIRVLGGAEFGQSIIVLQILLSGIVIFYLTQPLSWLIVTLNGQKYLPWIYLVSAIVNLSLNFVLIPKYSYLASAVLTWISEGIILILLCYFALKVWYDYFNTAHN